MQQQHVDGNRHDIVTDSRDGIFDSRYHVEGRRAGTLKGQAVLRLGGRLRTRGAGCRIVTWGTTSHAKQVKK
jgi:hypothetical protein